MGTLAVGIVVEIKVGLELGDQVRILALGFLTWHLAPWLLGA
jgi:hypothetical protein